jgi:hypothetical protein
LLHLVGLAFIYQRGVYIQISWAVGSLNGVLLSNRTAAIG